MTSFCVFLASACSNDKDQKITELTKKVEQLTKEKEQDFFNKSIECKKYEENIKKDFIEENLSSGMIQLNELQSVFYSSKKNSCLLAVRSIYWKDNVEILYIEDILSHEQIWSQDFHPIQKAGVAAQKLNEQIAILK
jgi:hypothetical protein